MFPDHFVNPYVVGPPVERQSFYGRVDIFRFVRQTLASRQHNVIVLYGQRRIGKTSVLYELLFQLPEGFHCVYFSLEGYAHKKLPVVLHDLAGAIADSLGVSAPEQADFVSDDRYFHHRFLPTLYETLGGKRLLLLLDEFDVLGDELSGKGAAIYAFFPYLLQLIADEPQLAFVFAVGRRLEELPIHYQSIFKQAQYRRISLLHREDAIQLITKPVAEVLEYDADAIEAILALTAGHPYFTQLICHEVFARKQEQNNTKVMAEDVRAVIDKAMETGHGALNWFWEGLPRAERFILATVAHITSERNVATEEQIRDVLQEYHVRLMGMELASAPEMLVQWEILEREERDSYKFVVELIERWIAREHPLEEAKRELEQVSPIATYLYEAAHTAHRDGDLETAVRLYRDALQTNPHHPSARLGLAQALYQQNVLAEAVTEYEEAYRLDEVGARDGLIRARLALGKSLEQEEKLKEAAIEYERVLEISPDQKVQTQLVRVLTKLANR